MYSPRGAGNRCSSPILVMDLYLVLFNGVLTDPEHVSRGREGFYIAENGEFNWMALSQEIGRVLFELGAVESAEPTPFTKEDLIQYFGSEVSSLRNYRRDHC